MRTRGAAPLAATARRSAVTLAVALALAATLGGCASLQVTPLSNSEVGGLSADDVVMLMAQAGFTEAEIREQGTALRNALALEGAARISNGKRTEAVFAVFYPYVHVSSMRRGSFIYDIGDAGHRLAQ